MFILRQRLHKPKYCLCIKYSNIKYIMMIYIASLYVVKDVIMDWTWTRIINSFLCTLLYSINNFSPCSLSIHPTRRSIAHENTVGSVVWVHEYLILTRERIPQMFCILLIYVRMNAQFGYFKGEICTYIQNLILIINSCN